MHIQFRLSVFSLVHCPLVILCTVDGGIFKVFAILGWRAFLWNCSTIFRWFFPDLWTFVHLYLQEALPLWNAPFIPSHVTELLSIKPISSQMLLHLFLMCANCFSSLLFQLFSDVLLPSKSKWANGKISQYQHLTRSVCSTFLHF